MRLIARVLAVAVGALVYIAAQTSPAQAQQATTPKPEVVKMVEAIAGAVNGDDAAVDKLVKDYFTAEYQKARTAEERRQWFAPIRARHGKIAVERLRRSAEDTFTIVAAGDKNTTLTFVVTHDGAFKISGLALDEGQ